ncbi:DUF3618 domain-containing protein [uncultured Jatrophihabitans sp.]|uniref:DUF3618 domain-containing protein n=1 Tax=uncultured Jatrophihabitans sp. TaxID=1610747 RepID=UPI0035CB9070
MTSADDNGSAADGASDAPAEPSTDTPPPTEPDAIRADIEATRAELADTVDALTAKLDVKAQASDKAHAAGAAAKEKVATAAHQAKAAAPPPVQHALDSVGAKAGPVAQQVAAKAEPHRGKIAAGAGVTLLVLLVVRRRRKRASAL